MFNFSWTQAFTSLDKENVGEVCAMHSGDPVFLMGSSCSSLDLRIGMSNMIQPAVGFSQKKWRGVSPRDATASAGVAFTCDILYESLRLMHF